MSTDYDAPGTTVARRDDPFELMDRLDDELIRKELEGIASDDLVYVVKGERGSDVVGLSKAGVDECCNVLAKQGEVIRETHMEWSRHGSGEAEEAFFIARAARFAVSKDGSEVKLDEVTGTKRVSLYYPPADEMHVDQVVPFGKYKREGKTWRDVVESDADYLAWMADKAQQEETRDFAAAVLAWSQGDAPEPRIIPGRRLNPFWFEHGSMKAARNARFRLIGAETRAMVIARAKDAGKVREVAQQTGGAPGAQDPPITEKQRALMEKLLKSSHMTERERAKLSEWLASDPTKAAASRAIDYWTDALKTRKQKNGDDETRESEPLLESDEPTDDAVSTSSDDDEFREPDGARKVALVSEIEELFEHVDKKTARTWRGLFNGLVEKLTESTVHDFETLKSKLTKALDA